jgi:hypothetical protein
MSNMELVTEALTEHCGSVDPNEEPRIPAVIGNKFAELWDTLPRAVIDARETLTLGLYPSIMKMAFSKYLSMLAFACEHPSRRKRSPMDVKKMVENWLPLVKKLAIAHDIDEKDAASSQLDEYLLPVVAAPVAEIRAFYRELTAQLKADPQVPWAVWRLFDFWGENVLDKIQSEGVLELKTEIAKRIAENSMKAIPPQDWINSMIGALQWRSPEKLKEIEAHLEAGAKPRVRGKESCLFLQVAGSEVML